MRRTRNHIRTLPRHGDGRAPRPPGEPGREARAAARRTPAGGWSTPPRRAPLSVERPKRGPRHLAGRRRRHAGHEQSPVGLGDLEELGRGDPGTEGLDPHPGASHLLGEGLGEREDEGLRGGVHGQVRNGLEGRVRRDVDDPTTAPRQHAREEGVGRLDHRAHVDVDHRPDRLGRLRLERGRVPEARAVDEEVAVTPRALEGLAQRSRRSGNGQVERKHDGLRARRPARGPGPRGDPPVARRGRLSRLAPRECARRRRRCRSRPP